jgi:hypothetical protein
MQLERRTWAASLGLGLAALLSACGGGGSAGNDTLAAAAGAYAGSTSTLRDVNGLVLADGRYYLLYSAVGDGTVVGGALQGTGTLDQGSLASADALDFNAEVPGSTPGAVDATLLARSRFDGTFTPTGGTAFGFTTAPVGASGLLRPSATLAALAGSYTGQAGFPLGVRPAVFTVAANGAVSSNINGCDIFGTATPRSDIDAYDLTIAFGAAPCAIPGLSFDGVAWLRPGTTRLHAVARNEPSKMTVIFAGTRD